MISKKILVFISFSLAILYHFILYLTSYGPKLGDAVANGNAFLALASSLILIFVYITTRWRVDFKGSYMVVLYDLMILYIVVCYFRSFLNIYKVYSLKEMILSPFVGLSLFPILFFIVGINPKYFYMINKILFLYCLIIFVLSLPFITYFELQFFLLLPIFYIIVTFPLQSPRDRILTFIISATVLYFSTTNRAGVLRISISYLIIIIFYLALKMKVSKNLINAIVILALLTPMYLLYLGLTGKDVFKLVLGENTEEGYAQENYRSDTRTFLYVDVFRDIKINNSYPFGKGINAGYASDDFETFDRMAVEVGFLQILLKSGIAGFILYSLLIITAIFKAINNSQNMFIKYLGMLLSGYVLMFFIENMILFNLLNILIWIIVGMCHSSELRNLNDEQIKALYSGITVPVTTK